MADRTSIGCCPGAGGGRCSQLGPKPSHGPAWFRDEGRAAQRPPLLYSGCLERSDSPSLSPLRPPQAAGHGNGSGSSRSPSLSLLNQWKRESLPARSPLGAHHKVSFSEDRLHRHLVGLPVARQPDGFDGREQLQDVADARGGGGDMALEGARDVELVQEGAVVADVELAMGRVLSGVIVRLWRGEGGRGGGGGDTAMDAQEGEDGGRDDEGEVDEDEGSGDSNGDG